MLWSRAVIIVTGTKRSGTSMWMQILIAAGFHAVGEAFPGPWAASIRQANPRGFFESKLRQGVYYATNPDPETGAFLHPAATQDHAVKVFIPGVVRSDMAYLHRVVATVRSWREYAVSVERLHALEESYGRAQGSSHAHERRGTLPPPVEWWFENYELIRDAAVRRYPLYLLTYDRLLRAPEREIAAVLRWIGKGDASAALRAVAPELRTQQKPAVPAGLDEETLSLFDEFYQTIDDSRALPAAFIGRMNALHARMQREWKGAARRDDTLPAD